MTRMFYIRHVVFHTEIKIHGAYFCGGYFRNDTMLEVQQFVECNQNCRRNSGEEQSYSKSFKSGFFSSSMIIYNEVKCDDKCDSIKCKDERLCYGHSYGIYCASRYDYNPVSRVCDRWNSYGCYNWEDEKDCENTTLPFETLKLDGP